eukprot:TRINITY_DN16570_c0_g1_i1.p1 TRINITY_DN16570_c0_g1~~TRINITY_DN16570_c0_g1_i1.p1  ORF type:complete len:773 (+),score=205.65 TRINITY_DN16570_c0_g1_i1:97-2319(+)
MLCCGEDSSLLISGSRWDALRSQHCDAEGWAQADDALRQGDALEVLDSADAPPLPPRLAAWPPYRDVAQALAPPSPVAALRQRPRLFAAATAVDRPPVPKRPSVTAMAAQRGAARRSGIPAQPAWGARQPPLLPREAAAAQRGAPPLGTPGTQHVPPPGEAWVSSVLSDWMVQLYEDVRAPLEPLLHLIRVIIAKDALNPDPEQQKYTTSLVLPRLKEELEEAAEARLPRTARDAYADVISRLGDWYEPRNPLRRLLCDSWVWVWHSPPDYVIPWTLESFVEQASPCCAAASAVGAANALLRRPRPSYCEWSNRTADMDAEPAPAASAPGAGRALCAEDGLRVLDRELVSMTAQSALQAGVDWKEEVMTQLVARVASELQPGGVLYAPPPTTSVQKVRCLEAVRSYLIELLPDSREGLLGLNFEPGADPRRKGCRHLTSLVSNVWGLAKLRCHRPSTARFGSWGVVAAVEQLERTLAPGLGAGVQSAVDYSFAEFTGLLCRGDCAVVLHLPNHYACVFAVRGDSVLTARKGQPPTDWITWEELLSVQRKREDGMIIVVYRLATAPSLKIVSSGPKLTGPARDAKSVPPRPAEPDPSARPRAPQRSASLGPATGCAAPPVAPPGEKRPTSPKPYGVRIRPPGAAQIGAQLGSGVAAPPPAAADSLRAADSDGRRRKVAMPPLGTAAVPVAPRRAASTAAPPRFAKPTPLTRRHSAADAAELSTQAASAKRRREPPPPIVRK